MFATFRRCFFLFLVAFETLNMGAQEYVNPTDGEYPVVAWYSVDGAHNTRVQYKQMAKAGFNLSLSSFLTKDEIIQGLQEARGTGVKLIVDCQESRNANQAFISEIKDNPALGMYYLCDEPKKDYFNVLRTKVSRIHSTDGVHEGYINLLPVYANRDQLNAESYDDYLDTYLKTVKTSFLSYDHYPFVREDFREDFYTNLELVSKKCQENGKQFWGFVRSCYSDNFYLIDEGRLRLQVFANIAYGAQGIQYFTYGVPKGSVSAIVDTSYNKTELYNIVRKINREIQVVGKYYLAASIEGVFHVGRENNSVLTSLIDNIEISGESILVSLFKKNNTMYVMMVNKDFLNTQTVNISFKNKTTFINKKGIKKVSRLKYKKEISAGDWLLFQLN